MTTILWSKFFHMYISQCGKTRNSFSLKKFREINSLVFNFYRKIVVFTKFLSKEESEREFPQFPNCGYVFQFSCENGFTWKYFKNQSHRSSLQRFPSKSMTKICVPNRNELKNCNNIFQVQTFEFFPRSNHLTK